MLTEEEKELREQCAAIEHDRWSKWQKYVHSVCIVNDDETLTIPIWAVEHWKRQIITPYANLTEREKDADRLEVDRYLPLFYAIISRLVKENEELRENLNKTAEAHCETQAWWNTDAKKLVDVQSQLDAIKKAAEDNSLCIRCRQRPRSLLCHTCLK